MDHCSSLHAQKARQAMVEAAMASLVFWDEIYKKYDSSAHSTCAGSYQKCGISPVCVPPHRQQQHLGAHWQAANLGFTMSIRTTVLIT
ncbi:MAG: hypothetical protein ABI410_16520, partial [Rhodoferax sp.]|uniref:hypothetical protein n=1 Tax=Rhodoferax sp. TaxID=50421 RepID=UPI003266E3BC